MSASKFKLYGIFIVGSTETVLCTDHHYHHHSWLEWVSFINRLKTRDYLAKSSIPLSQSSIEGRDGINNTTDGVGILAIADRVYRDMKLVKDVCISFARDHYDIFKWKPPGKDDIESSARRPISQLIELCESSHALSFRQSTGKDVLTKSLSPNLMTAKLFRDVEIKRGDKDWTCPNFRFVNFVRNIRCLKCKERSQRCSTQMTLK